jgi:hypothetical protein
MNLPSNLSKQNSKNKKGGAMVRNNYNEQNKNILISWIGKALD